MRRAIPVVIAIILLGPASLLCQTTRPDPQPGNAVQPPDPPLPSEQGQGGGNAATAPDSARPAAVELYARGDYPAVIATLAPAFAADTLGIQDRLLLARAYLHSGQPGKATPVLESVLASDSENPDANHLLGQQLFAAGRFDDAVKPLDRAYKLRKQPAVASLLGQAHLALGDRNKAKQFLEAALAEDVRNPANSFTLGKMYLADGAGAQAEKFLLLAQEAGLESIELHHLLGQAYLLQRKFVGPVLTRRLATAAKPGDIVDEHVVLRKLDDQPDTYLVCTRYCALYEGLWIQGRNPNRVPIVDGRSRPLSIAEQRRFADAHFMVASGWFAAGQLDLADHWAIRLPGNERRAYDLISQIAIATKDFNRLDKKLQHGLEQKIYDAPAIADFYYKAAVVLRAEGKRAEALAMLTKADAAVPTSAPVLRALATLSAATGDRDAARKYYARIIELFPDATDIDELRNAHRNLGENAGGQQ